MPKSEMTDAQPLAPRERITLDAKNIGLTLKLSPEELAEIADKCRPRKKANYVGAPAIFALELACQQLREAFGWGLYLVGSALKRPDWRDVDVVHILSDDDFAVLFPDANTTNFEHNPRWLVMTVGISAWLSKASGLPIDFKFQPQTWANQRHNGERHALGLKFVKETS